MTHNSAATQLPCGHTVLDPEQVHYCDYLSLDALTALAEPYGGARDFDQISDDHHFFVAIHQSFEVLFLQHIRLLESAIASLNAGDFDRTVARVEHITRITRAYSGMMYTLLGMQPADFFEFRNQLVPASGMESINFRIIEVVSGITHNTPYSKHGDRTITYYEFLNRAPSEGAHRPKTCLWTPELERYASSRRWSLRTAFCSVYGQMKNRNGHALRQLQPVMAALRAYDRAFTQFRAAHVAVVRHQIGDKVGTGFSSGVPYLEYIRDHVRFFPELSNLQSCV